MPDVTLSNWPLPGEEHGPSRTPRLLIVLVACGALILTVLIGMWLLRVDLPLNQVSASMALDPTANGRVIQVAATTDLPDGARIFYYFYHERNDVEWTGGLPPYNVQGYTEVAGGKFRFEGDLSTWPPGVVTIWAEFAVYEGEQPAHILELFGQLGERLGGPQSSYADSSDYKQLYVETDVTLP
jgi:hypothetical protein